MTAPEVVVQAAKATEAEAGAHFSREVYRMGSMEVGCSLGRVCTT